MTDVWTQAWRFGIVGIVSNVALFLVYLLLTRLGLGPKVAMTLVYGAGVLQTFVFNRRWSFEDEGHWAPSLVRYVVVYALGYFLNLAVLLVFVDALHLPHEWVQAITILAVAAVVFLLQRYWVFRQESVIR